MERRLGKHTIWRGGEVERSRPHTKKKPPGSEISKRREALIARSYQDTDIHHKSRRALSPAIRTTPGPLLSPVTPSLCLHLFSALTMMTQTRVNITEVFFSLVNETILITPLTSCRDAALSVFQVVDNGVLGGEEEGERGG